MNKQPGIKRGIGFFSLFCIAIGVIVGQSTIVSLLQAAGIAGWGFLGAMAIAYVLMLCNSATFAELALMMPRHGGLSAYCEASLGHFPAIFAVFAGYVVPALFGQAAELMLVDSVMAQILPGAMPTMGWAVLLLAVLVILNYLGTDVFARTQTLLTVVMLVFLALTGIVAASGGFHAGAPVASGAGLAAMAENVTVIGVVSLVLYSLIGTEFVTPLAEDAENPARDIPRAMFIGLTVVTIANALFCIGAGLLLSRETLTTAATPHLEYAVAVFGPMAKLVFGAIAITATASLVNTVLGALPQMLHGMAMSGQVFPVFKRLSSRYRTPWVALLFVACLPLVGVAWSGGDVGNILPLIIAAASAWLISYMIAHLALIVLRLRMPDAPRPYRVPLFPLPQVIAILGLGYVVANSAPAPELVAPIFTSLGLVLALIAVIGALWIKIFMKKGLFEANPALIGETPKHH
jgi:amino acid transporter